MLCVQGECTGASLENLPELSPGLTSLKSGQCVVLGHEDLMVIWSPDIWLDNLYLRAHYKLLVTDVPREDTFISLAGLPPVEGPRLGTTTRYFTNMTFQGDGKGPTVGVFADEPTYIEGVSRLDTLHAHTRYLIYFKEVFVCECMFVGRCLVHENGELNSASWLCR